MLQIVPAHLIKLRGIVALVHSAGWYFFTFIIVFPSCSQIIFSLTGLAESVVSGALSRVGKSVLHLDWNDFYGGSWASFNIKAFEDYLIRSEDSFSHLSKIGLHKLLRENVRFSSNIFASLKSVF